MIDLDNFIISQKLVWMKCLITTEAPWASLLSSVSLKRLNTLGPWWSKHLSEKTSNHFWKYVFDPARVVVTPGWWRPSFFQTIPSLPLLVRLKYGIVVVTYHYDVLSLSRPRNIPSGWSNGGMDATPASKVLQIQSRSYKRWECIGRSRYCYWCWVDLWSFETKMWETF